MITLLHTPPIKINNPGAAVNGLHLTLSYTFDREVQGRSQEGYGISGANHCRGNRRASHLLVGVAAQRASISSLTKEQPELSYWDKLNAAGHE